MIPVKTPSQKPTCLGWKIPMFNRKYIDSFMVDLPAKSCEFSGGYICKILGFGKRYLRSNHGNLGYQFVKFQQGGMNSEGSTGAECRKNICPKQGGFGKLLL